MQRGRTRGSPIGDGASADSPLPCRLIPTTCMSHLGTGRCETARTIRSETSVRATRSPLARRPRGGEMRYSLHRRIFVPTLTMGALLATMLLFAHTAGGGQAAPPQPNFGPKS